MKEETGETKMLFEFEGKVPTIGKGTYVFENATVIGEVVEDPNSFVQMETIFGGRRMIDWLAGEQLPRIC